MISKKTAEISGAVFCTIGLILLLCDNDKWYIFTIIGIVVALTFWRGKKTYSERDAEAKINRTIWKTADMMEALISIAAVICMIAIPASVWFVLPMLILMYIILGLLKTITKK